MNVWLTSDLHIGHQKVAETRVADHDQTLAANWDAVIRPGDSVWVLGDISAGGREAQLNALEWVKARPGVKHLILGNHDAHPLYRDSYKWQRTYLEAFESVQLAARRRVKLPEGHVSVFLSHFLYVGDRGEDRYPEWRLRDFGSPVVHGHTHSTGKVSYSPSGALQIHVGVDAWGLKPANWVDVCEIVQREFE